MKYAEIKAPGRRHPQKSDAPIEEVEDHRADRDGAEIVSVGQMSDDGGIDGAQQRHRDVGQNDRKRESPDPTMPDAGSGRAIGHPAPGCRAGR